MSLCSASIFLDFEWQVHSDQCGSDHFSILIDIVKSMSKENVPRWNLKKAHWPKFKLYCSLDINRHSFTDITEKFPACLDKLNVPLWVRGCRIGPTYPPACRKRRLIGGSLFAVGCDPCQWKRGSWLLSQYFLAALRRQYTALASISLSRKVKMAWLNQSAGSAKP